MDPSRAAHEAGLALGHVDAERYHYALGYLVEEAALVGDEHTATEAGAQQAYGCAVYFFTRRALKLLEGSREERGVEFDAREGSEDITGEFCDLGGNLRRQKYSGQRSRSR